MKILVIGGTRFIGKAVASLGISRGHDVTLFNRGKAAIGAKILPGTCPSEGQVPGDFSGFRVTSVCNRARSPARLPALGMTIISKIDT